MDFLEENNLLDSNQSGFRPNNSCESQLLSVVHDFIHHLVATHHLKLEAHF